MAFNQSRGAGSYQYVDTSKKPINEDPPTEADLQSTAALMEQLKAMNAFESEKEGRLRTKVLGNIQAMVERFVKEVYLEQGMSQEQADQAGGKIYTYGSYRLGVHGPQSDIDTLIVVPKRVSRADFFGKFAAILKESPDVTEVTPVPEAFTPIIKAIVGGIDIDFGFGRVNRDRIPQDLDLLDDSVLRGLDETEARSINGSRVTDSILELVPNKETFKDALRAIKIWARQRCIYSNILGFLGGVQWAILVARTCQMYPNASPSQVVKRFFVVFGNWNWPNPVYLTPFWGNKTGVRGTMSFKEWNPQLYVGDRLHHMPIITPAFPCMCATHSVGESTMKVMKEEFKRAAQITNDVLDNKPGCTWANLFEELNFFNKYKWYIAVIASAAHEDKINQWAGTVESKLRTLVTQLHDNIAILNYAHPYIEGKSAEHICLNADEIRDAATGKAPVEGRKKADYIDRQDIEVSFVYTTTFYIGLELHKRPKGEKQSMDLSYPTQQFCRQVKQWPLYDEPHMGIAITPVKQSALPSNLRTPTGNSGRRLKRRAERALGNEDLIGSQISDEQEFQPYKRQKSHNIDTANGLLMDDPANHPEDEVPPPTDSRLDAIYNEMNGSASEMAGPSSTAGITPNYEAAMQLSEPLANGGEE